jgi:hypothetical protein
MKSSRYYPWGTFVRNHILENLIDLHDVTVETELNFYRDYYLNIKIKHPKNLKIDFQNILSGIESKINSWHVGLYSIPDEKFVITNLLVFEKAWENSCDNSNNSAKKEESFLSKIISMFK